MNNVDYTKCTGVVFNANSPSRQFSHYGSAFDTSCLWWRGGGSRGLAAASYVKITSIAPFMT